MPARVRTTYAAPGPHGALPAGPVACGEARPALGPGSRHHEVLQADRLAIGLAAALHQVTPALARSMAVFVRKKMWFEFGFARLEDCARERFGRSGRWARDLAILGEAFDRMPALAAALTGEAGSAGRTPRPPLGKLKALALARVATPESLPAWLDVARESTIRTLRAQAREAVKAGSVWPPGLDPQATPAAGSQPPDVSDDELRLVRYMVPAPVLAAFEETLELYRAVVGSQASVTSFVEALVGEELSGACPPDVEAEVPQAADFDSRPLGGSMSRSVVEEALARSTGNWGHLPAPDAGAWAMALAGSSLARLEALSREAGRGGPAGIDAQIRELVGISNQLRCRLGRLLSEMSGMDAWSRLRFDGAGHYAEQRLALPRSTAEGLLRAARALRDLPVVRQAYEEGRIGIEAVLQILRALGPARADAPVQEAWVARASAATIKRLRDESLALRRRAAQAGGGAQPPMPMEDAGWQASVRREPGMARRRIARLGVRALAAPDPDVFLRLTLPSDLAGLFTACVESRRRCLTRLVDKVAWDQPWPDPDAPASVLAARTFSIRCRRAPAWVGLLAMLEGFADIWDDPRLVPRRPDREIHVRDGYRCTAPGCTSRARLQVHHTVYRSHGGGDQAWIKTLLCLFHHLQGEHGGLARVRGHAPLGLTWRLGRAGLGVWFRNELRIQARAGADSGRSGA
ncbi:MAG TPA: hypothetical protein VFP98_09995 [Candidatus Polarisedimenticolia bacterium]|nr:hypothetical protein [Candidatus Polarisedimenticolia bacterium]